jgi:hypothetical protein
MSFYGAPIYNTVIHILTKMLHLQTVSTGSKLRTNVDDDGGVLVPKTMGGKKIAPTELLQRSPFRGRMSKFAPLTGESGSNRSHKIG